MQAELHKQQAVAGLAPSEQESAFNARCSYQTVAEEKEARTDAVI